MNKKLKPSELFEGENSGLRKAFDEAVARGEVHTCCNGECNHEIESNMCKPYCRKCGFKFKEELLDK